MATRPDTTRSITVAQCVYDLTRAGAQQVVSQLVTLASKHGLRMKVYAFVDGALSNEIRDAGAEICILQQRVPYFDPSLVVRLAACFKRDGVDVVHTHLFGADLHAGLAATVVARIPVITTIHSDLYRNWRQKIVAGCLLNRFDRIVGVGGGVAEYLSATWPRLRTRVITIPNGVTEPQELDDLRERSRRLLGCSEADQLIGSIGRLVPQKAHTDLLQAFEIVVKREPRAKLAILGEGPLRGELESQRLRLGLSGRVLIPGNLPQASRLVSGFDVFVLSSHWEAMPMSLLEAMIAGVPCVATDVGCNRELIADRETGRLVPAGRPDLLAQAIVNLLASPREAARLGSAAREFVVSKYTAAAMASAYQGLYRDLAGRAATVSSDSPGRAAGA